MFFIGMLWAGAIAALVAWLIFKKVSVKWYEWLLGALALLFAMMTVQHYFGSLNELEPTSAWMGALIFGVIAVILAAVTFQLVWRHNRAAS